MIITKILMNSSSNYCNKKGFIDNAANYSYGELGMRAEKVKHSLQKFGTKHGDRVAILLSNSSQYLEITFGISAMGAIFVPLNTRLKPDELAYILNDSGARTLFIGSEFLTFVPTLKKLVKGLKTIIQLDTDNKQDLNVEDVYSYENFLISDYSLPLQIENVKEDDIAGIFYTSGTTGKPKGVIHTHKSLYTSTNNHVIYLQMKHDDIFLHALPFFHIGGYLGFLGRTLIGSTNVAISSFDTQTILQLCETEKLNSLVLVPTMVNMLLNDPNFDSFNTGSLDSLSYGGSPMPLEIFKKITKKIPSLKFSQGYGSTETASAIMVLTNEHHTNSLIGNEEKVKKRLKSVGQPVSGVEVKILGPDKHEVSKGETGEIVVRGPMLMKGYWNLPKETERALQDGWYFTGDVGYRDEENFYYIVDRAKDMIISGGENIYSIEVESVVYQHPKILECAVIGVPDEKWGEAVKAIVVVKPGLEVTEEEVISFVRNHLANYKVPKSVDFLDELPKNGAGKIQKHELRKKYWEEQTRMIN